MKIEIYRLNFGIRKCTPPGREIRTNVGLLFSLVEFPVVKDCSPSRYRKPQV